MTYTEQACAFDWKTYDRYNSRWRNGEGGVSTNAIAAEFGRPPCEVRRVLLDGARLWNYRPA